MPSRRKRDAGKNKLVHLAPATANGWISILKTICGAMKRRYELERDTAEALDPFPLPRTYTREQANALTAAQAPVLLVKMKDLHPQHYAMVFLGFVTGARPSTLRPLRRSGPEQDVLWEEGVILLRRSNSLGKEIMDRTKTALDQEIPLPIAARRVLRQHVAARRQRRAAVGHDLEAVGDVQAHPALEDVLREELRDLRARVVAVEVVRVDLAAVAQVLEEPRVAADRVILDEREVDARGRLGQDADELRLHADAENQTLRIVASLFAWTLTFTPLGTLP